MSRHKASHTLTVINYRMETTSSDIDLETEDKYIEESEREISCHDIP